jgi:hypothetical protein
VARTATEGIGALARFVVCYRIAAPPAVVLLRHQVPYDKIITGAAVVFILAKPVVALLVGDIVVSRAAVHLIGAGAADEVINLSLGPVACPYSPECVEGVFLEVACSSRPWLQWVRPLQWGAGRGRT